MGEHEQEIHTHVKVLYSNVSVIAQIMGADGYAERKCFDSRNLLPVCVYRKFPQDLKSVVKNYRFC
jgi:hypothetical protein